MWRAMKSEGALARSSFSSQIRQGRATRSGLFAAARPNTTPTRSAIRTRRTPSFGTPSRWCETSAADSGRGSSEVTSPSPRPLAVRGAWYAEASTYSTSTRGPEKSAYTYRCLTGTGGTFLASSATKVTSTTTTSCSNLWRATHAVRGEQRPSWCPRYVRYETDVL